MSNTQESDNSAETFLFNCLMTIHKYNIYPFYKECCKCGQIDIIKKMNLFDWDLNGGSFTRVIESDIYDFLKSSIENNHYDIVKYLIDEYGQYINITTYDLFILALRAQDQRIFEYVYEFAINSESDINIFYLLKKIIKTQKYESFQYLLDKNININTFFEILVELLAKNKIDLDIAIKFGDIINEYKNIDDVTYLSINKIIIDNNLIDLFINFFNRFGDDDMVRSLFDYSVETNSNIFKSHLITYIKFESDSDLFMQKIKLNDIDSIKNLLDNIDFETLLEAYEYTIINGLENIKKLLHSKIIQFQKKSIKDDKEKFESFELYNILINNDIGKYQDIYNGRLDNRNIICAINVLIKHGHLEFAKYILENSSLTNCELCELFNKQFEYGSQEFSNYLLKYIK